MDSIEFFAFSYVVTVVGAFLWGTIAKHFDAWL